MDLNSWLVAVGVLIVVGTHLYMLVNGLPAEQMTGHAVVNLVAAGLIVYGGYKKGVYA